MSGLHGGLCLSRQDERLFDQQGRGLGEHGMGEQRPQLAGASDEVGKVTCRDNPFTLRREKLATDRDRQSWLVEWATNKYVAGSQRSFYQNMA